MQSLTISALSEPHGEPVTHAYGRGYRDSEEDRDGFVYVRNTDGWLAIRYSPFHHVLPVDGGQLVYKARIDDTIVDTTPDELADTLPDSITVPDSYAEFTSDEYEEFEVIWHGTYYNQATNTDDSSKPFVDAPDGLNGKRKRMREWDAIISATQDGFETEEEARSAVDESYYDSAVSDRDRNPSSERE